MPSGLRRATLLHLTPPTFVKSPTIIILPSLGCIRTSFTFPFTYFPVTVKPLSNSAVFSSILIKPPVLINEPFRPKEVKLPANKSLSGACFTTFIISSSVPHFVEKFSTLSKLPPSISEIFAKLTLPAMLRIYFFVLSAKGSIFVFFNEVWFLPALANGSLLVCKVLVLLAKGSEFWGIDVSTEFTLTSSVTVMPLNRPPTYNALSKSCNVLMPPPTQTGRRNCPYKSPL